MSSPITPPGESALAKRIDHTLLKPTATAPDFRRLFEEAVRYGFWSVCIPPSWVSASSSRLKGTGVRTCTVIGFPFGYTSSSAKLAEATAALKEGADEIDMVINVGALKGGDYELVAREIRDASGECKKSRKLLKVIVECCYLSDPEKVRVSQMAEDLGADFIKTSTGFGTGGATAADVALIKQCLTGRAKVKASGGVTTLSKAQEMIRAGAERIGTSSGVAIMDEFLAPRRANLRPTGKRI